MSSDYRFDFDLDDLGEAVRSTASWVASTVKAAWTTAKRVVMSLLGYSVSSDDTAEVKPVTYLINGFLATLTVDDGPPVPFFSRGLHPSYGYGSDAEDADEREWDGIGSELLDPPT